MDLREVEEVLDRHRLALMAVPGVVGTAIGVCNEKPCIRVFVAGVGTDVSALPTSLDGFDVSTEVSGPFVARARPPSG